MRKIYLLLFCMFLSYMQTFAQHFTVNSLQFEVIEGANMEVRLCSNQNPYISGAVEVPSQVTYNNQQYSVTEIASQAFNGCTQISSLSIPESVKSLGTDVIVNCYQLRTLSVNMIDIPANAFQNIDFYTLIIGPTVKTIGQDAFKRSYTQYKTIWLPNVVPSGSPISAASNINYCSSPSYQGVLGRKTVIYTNLTSKFEVNGIVYVRVNNSECDVIDCNYTSVPTPVNIGSSVTYEGQTMNVRHINNYACIQNRKMSGDIIVSNLGNVGESAFASCSATGSITVTNQGDIGSGAFSGCSVAGNITATNQGNIGDGAFSECSSLTGSITIANQGHIGSRAFQGCSKASSIIVENNGDIGEYAFSGCALAKSAEIKNNGDVGDFAFENCSSLQTLDITNKGTIGVNAFINSRVSQTMRIENEGAIMRHAFYEVKGNYSATINNKGEIGDSAFFASEIKDLTINSNVTSIGVGCFRSSTISQQAVIQNSDVVKNYAFSKINDTTNDKFIAYIRHSGPIPIGCFQYSKMSNVYIGELIDSIKDYAFNGATGFREMLIPDNVQFVGKNSFASCSTMESVTLSRGIHEIADSTFSDCTVLASLFVPKEIDKIDNYVFNNCPALKIMTFEDKDGNYTLGIGGCQETPVPLFATSGIESVYIGGKLLYNKNAPTYSPFYENATLRKVEYADNEVKIYSKEFLNCTNLQTVLIGSSVNAVGESAFQDCTSLAQITMGLVVEEIGHAAFCGCSALSNIDLKNVVTIRSNAFQNCISLSQISIPLSVRIIGDQTFNGCSSLRNFYVEDRTESLALGINEYASSYKGITDAGTPLFSDCPLDSIYIGGPISYSQTKESGYSPFFYHESLRSVCVTKEEKTVYTNEFYNCMGLQNVKLGDGVTRINDYGFQSCTGLIRLEFASTLQTIGEEAFSDCMNVKEIISYATLPPVCGANALSDINQWTCKVYVPDGTIEAYQEADQWSSFFNYEEIAMPLPYIKFADESVKAICVANWDTNHDGELSEPEAAAVTDLGTVFINKSGIISFDELSYFTGLTEIGQGAFSDCVNLTSVTIPSSVTSIEDFAFDNCSSITSVIIPNSVTSIGYNAFFGCSSLTSVTIPNSVTSIGVEAFIGTGMYNNCIDGVFYVDNWVCGYKGELPANAEISFLDGTYGISSASFRGMSNLISLTIPNSVNCIGDYAFQSCNNLNRISFGKSVTTVGRRAFYGSTSLSVVIMESAMPFTIDDETFSNRRYAILYIPVGSKSNYEAAVYWKDFMKIIEGSEPENYIDFADAVVKQICVENWDANTDGELSEAEAALVTDLGSAFTGKTNITSFDELQYFVGLTSIGESAFSGCSGLTSVMIPNTVTSIGNQAFLRCSSMTSISIPNSVTTIGSDVLNRCSGLTSVTIPSSVTSIGNSLFMYCSNLTTVNVASDNSKYDSRDNCNAIIETSSNKLIAGCKNSFIPNSVTSIGNYAFAGITYFSIYSGGMEIPNSVTSIGNYAFASSGIIWINLPNSINSIGSEAFGGCTGLSSVRIPENVTTIQNRTFLNCKNLIDVKIPDGVSLISYRAFEGCTSLTEITIPSSVTTISGLVFNRCTGLTTITVKAENPASINNTSDNNSFPTRADITLFVPIGSKPAYTSTTAWEGFKEIVSIIPFADSEVKQICVEKWDTNGDGELSDNEAAAVTDLDHAFQAKEEITLFDELQYFTGLTSLGDYEFSWSPSLRSVIIPDNVTSLGNAVFDDTGMYTDAPDGVFYVDKWACGYKGDVMPKTISIEEGTRGIANFAFRYFSSLTSVRIPNSVEYIGDYSFQECSSLESITLGNSVKSIGNSAFEKCSKLASLSIPNSVTNIGSNAFKECSRLTELFIPSSATSIGNCAFVDCSLTSISVDSNNPVYDSRNDCNAIIETATNALLVGCNNTEIPSSVTSIGDYAFYNCQTLTGITIPNSLTTIGNSAFRYCYGLTNMIIPNSVMSIGDYTFASCHGLKSLTLGDYVTTIGEGAFQQCSDLSSVTLGNSVLSIGNSAFFWCSNLTSVTAKMQTPVSIHTSVFTNRTNATLYVPYGKKSAYEAAEYWKEFKEIFEIAAKSGDANGDEEVTIADVVAVVNYITTNGNPAGQFIASAADVDGVEGITIADAIAIVNMILSSGS